MTLDMAMGGSTNTVLHLLAMANEAGVQFRLEDIDASASGRPTSAAWPPPPRPRAASTTCRTCHRAGGIHTILGQLWWDRRPGLLHDRVP